MCELAISTATSKSVTDTQDIYISGKENYEIEIIDGATNLPGEENGKKGASKTAKFAIICTH